MANGEFRMASFHHSLFAILNSCSSLLGRQAELLEELAVVLDVELASALLDERTLQVRELLLHQGGAGLLAVRGVLLGIPALVVGHLEQQRALSVRHRAA